MRWGRVFHLPDTVHLSFHAVNILEQVELFRLNIVIIVVVMQLCRAYTLIRQKAIFFPFMSAQRCYFISTQLRELLFWAAVFPLHLKRKPIRNCIKTNEKR